MNPRALINRFRSHRLAASFFDAPEHAFPIVGAGGYWADDLPDPGDDDPELTDEHGRGECAA